MGKLERLGLQINQTNMKTAFLTEMVFHGRVNAGHTNMRTEFAWMCALQSDHFNIHEFETVKGYDVVFIIFPKAVVKLNTEGLEMQLDKSPKDMIIYHKPIMESLKKNNSKVCVVQEGPSWFFNDYDLLTQMNFYNKLADADIIFAHNTYDTHFYKGLFPQIKIEVIPTLAFAQNLGAFKTLKDDKAIIGGNFCRWYGGFQSYVVASEFHCPIFAPSMHCKQKGEEGVPNLKHIPYMMWNEWMEHLSTYKYAVHLMPTVAAGTFSLNCACLGIPCIGNDKVDTQSVLFPDLSVDVNDIHEARFLAIQLRENREFYEQTAHHARSHAYNSWYANPEKWLRHMETTIYG
jgi:hypothetical protein